MGFTTLLIVPILHQNKVTQCSYSVMQLAAIILTSASTKIQIQISKSDYSERWLLYYIYCFFEIRCPHRTLILLNQTLTISDVRFEVPRGLASRLVFKSH